MPEATEDFTSAKILIEVVAGLLPGKDPDPRYTRRWAITSEEWRDAEDEGTLLAERNGQAQGYAAWLMMQPDRLNWVRLDWVYV